MSTTRKAIFAGAFALAFTFVGGTQAQAADQASVLSQPPTPMVGATTIRGGSSGAAQSEAESRLRAYGLDPDRFNFSGMTGRDINAEMHIVGVKSGS